MATAAMDFTGIDEQHVDTSQHTEQTQEIEQQPEGGEQQQQQTEQLDGRRGPQNIRASIKSLSESSPENAENLKALGNGYFRAEAYSKVFPKVEDAQAAKQLIDGVGGLDGLTQIQSRIQGYDAQDEGLKSGDPAILDAAFKDFAEGMTALAPHYLEKLGKANPEALQNAVIPYVMGMLNDRGVLGHVASMAQEKDPARLTQMAATLNEWLTKQETAVKNLKQTPQANPQDAKFKEQQEQFQRQQDEFFTKQVDSAVNMGTSAELGKQIDQYAKSLKLNDVQKARFGSALAQRIVQEMLADDVFKKQDALRKGGKDRSVENVASYRTAEFIRRLPDAAFKEAQELYGATKRPDGGTGVVKPTSPKTAPGGGPLLISRAPDISELDLSKDPNQYLFIANKGYLKSNGSFVTWR